MSRVKGAPPAKDGALSIFNPAHASHPLVVALRAAVADVIRDRQPFIGVPLRLTMHYRRANSRADGLNLMNGVGDVLQQRQAWAECASGAFVFDDDANIRQFSYTEEPASSDSYTIIVEKLAG